MILIWIFVKLANRQNVRPTQVPAGKIIAGKSPNRGSPNWRKSLPVNAIRDPAQRRKGAGVNPITNHCDNDDSADVIER